MKAAVVERLRREYFEPEAPVRGDECAIRHGKAKQGGTAGRGTPLEFAVIARPRE